MAARRRRNDRPRNTANGERRHLVFVSAHNLRRLRLVERLDPKRALGATIRARARHCRRIALADKRGRLDVDVEIAVKLLNLGDRGASRFEFAFEF